MKCPTCGHAIDADMRFCPECGTVCVAPQQTNIEPTVTEPQKPKKSKFSIRPKLLVSIIVLALCGVVYLVSATVLSCNSGMTFFDSLSKVAADEQEITVFDSTGIALQDLASAAVILRKAEAEGVGLVTEL